MNLKGNETKGDIFKHRNKYLKNYLQYLEYFFSEIFTKERNRLRQK